MGKSPTAEQFFIGDHDGEAHTAEDEDDAKHTFDMPAQDLDTKQEQAQRTDMTDKFEDNAADIAEEDLCGQPSCADDFDLPDRDSEITSSDHELKEMNAKHTSDMHKQNLDPTATDIPEEDLEAATPLKDDDVNGSFPFWSARSQWPL